MKELVLLRGLPGAGKSTLARMLAGEAYPALSVDDYFTDPDGNYHFESDKNHLAYKQCEQMCEAEVKKGTAKIFVHNTFTMDWEMEPYLKMAKQYNYRLHVITVENYHENSNIHDVSKEQLEKMAEKYKVKLL
jgi:predicted kinase